ncbi:MAG: hypothetical protein K0S65_2391 [Labilithrix sp.]|nr:hypothetical protein [Labilithrix sp.]
MGGEIVESQTNCLEFTLGMAGEHRIPEHLRRLLRTSIESVERLDVLLHLREHRGKSFGARSVAQALYISSVHAEEHLAILCGRGFLTVSIASDLLYGYQPASAALDTAMEEIVELARVRRPDIDALLHGPGGRASPHVFADAFLLRKPNRKGSKDG